MLQNTLGYLKNNTQPVTSQIIAGLICLGEDADIHVQSKLLRLNISCRTYSQAPRPTNQTLWSNNMHLEEIYSTVFYYSESMAACELVTLPCFYQMCTLQKARVVRKF